MASSFKVTALSDHHAQVYVLRKIAKSYIKDKYKLKWVFNDANIDIFKNSIKVENWSSVYTFLSKIHNNILTTQSQYISSIFPFKKI